MSTPSDFEAKFHRAMLMPTPRAAYFHMPKQHGRHIITARRHSMLGDAVPPPYADARRVRDEAAGRLGACQAQELAHFYAVIPD